MSRRTLTIALGLVAAGAAWYAFRPERLVIDSRVAETLPPEVAVASATGPEVAPVVLLQGQFHTNAHETRGVATLYQYADGRRILRLTDFATSNGPDVRVYLVAAPDVQDNETVQRAGFVDLGAMKGNQGDQNYEIPAEVDLAKFRAATVWCRRFSVNFGTAPLAAPNS